MKNHGKFLVITGCAAAVLFMSVLPEAAFAVEGDGIFKAAAAGIVDKVLPGSFGATCAVVAGVLALVAAATGSYRGAWALVFVVFACYLARNVLEILFST